MPICAATFFLSPSIATVVKSHEDNAKPIHQRKVKKIKLLSASSDGFVIKPRRSFKQQHACLCRLSLSPSISDPTCCHRQKQREDGESNNDELPNEPNSTCHHPLQLHSLHSRPRLKMLVRAGVLVQAWTTTIPNTSQRGRREEEERREKAAQAAHQGKASSGGARSKQRRQTTSPLSPHLSSYFLLLFAPHQHKSTYQSLLGPVRISFSNHARDARWKEMN